MERDFCVLCQREGWYVQQTEGLAPYCRLAPYSAALERAITDYLRNTGRGQPVPAKERRNVPDMGGSPIERLKAAVSVLSVAEQLTALHLSGNGMKGLCPLHDERTPSFYVWPDEDRWYCFGCNEGGDQIDLWEQAHRRGRI